MSITPRWGIEKGGWRNGKPVDDRREEAASATLFRMEPIGVPGPLSGIKAPGLFMSESGVLGVITGKGAFWALSGRPVSVSEWGIRCVAVCPFPD